LHNCKVQHLLLILRTKICSHEARLVNDHPHGRHDVSSDNESQWDQSKNAQLEGFLICLQKMISGTGFLEQDKGNDTYRTSPFFHSQHSLWKVWKSRSISYFVLHIILWSGYCSFHYGICSLTPCLVGSTNSLLRNLRAWQIVKS
jgi:hypothetical protein